MKLINVDAGRAGTLVPFNEIAPIGGVYMPEVVAAIIQRYMFVQTPDFSPESMGKNGLIFKMGKVPDREPTYPVWTLTIYRDGILVDSADTQESQQVINGLLSWLTENFAFRRFATTPERFQTSSILVVELEGNTGTAFHKFESLFKSASKLIQNQFGIEREVSMTRFAFDIDPTTVKEPLAAMPMFTIERQINQPVASNRFWSQAPVHTQDHIRLLEEFEKLLQG
jgi:hypothetical protein